MQVSFLFTCSEGFLWQELNLGLCNRLPECYALGFLMHCTAVRSPIIIIIISVFTYIKHNFILVNRSVV